MARPAFNHGAALELIRSQRCTRSAKDVQGTERERATAFGGAL
jgi:hypothetical protein